MIVVLLLRKSLSTNKKMKEIKNALGTWAWGAILFLLSLPKDSTEIQTMRKTLIITIMTAIALNASAQIDLHSHAITKGYLDYIKANDAEMDEGFPIPAWDAEQHIAFMDKAGIQTAVLTMPAPQPWFGDAEASAAVCRSYNEECAALKTRYPGRFMFCAALPLPDVDAAIREAVYALDTLKADGIKLATNVNGQYLGVPELDTLFSVLNERGAVVILHLSSGEGGRAPLRSLPAFGCPSHEVVDRRDASQQDGG